ncbi:hypothetical protein [Paenibacillus bovis]|uniref:Uncharacterized protein n=1 Tax=Paenibacillus bovis TaxID=1616788 RepID=A0A1X9T459_9BACL|nr:hypothetical protein [Paenibacillus bovis]ARR10656.1 hypothetical protein AR543_p0048 [Paenibacillus bovis]
MGDYTGIRCKVVLKPAFIPWITTLVDGDGKWSDLGFAATDHLAQLSRGTELGKNEIGSAYMPEEWTTPDAQAACCNRVEQGIWTFQMDLKEEEDEVDWFIQQVIPLIAEKTLWLEVFRAYEPYTHSTLYTYAQEAWSLSTGPQYRWQGAEDPFAISNENELKNGYV